MYLYKKIDKFDSKTGKLIGQQWEFDKLISDITGNALEHEDQYNRYHIDYDSCDPCFGCNNEEHQLANDFKFDIFDFLNTSYVIEDGDIDLTSFPTFMEGLKIGFLDHALRLSRVRMARLLIEGKKYTKEQLFGPYLSEDDEDDE